MIPNNLALIPHNVHQFAATQAIIDVERKQLRGTQLGQHPYARALFRHLRGGAMRITAKDIRFAAGDYSPKERGGASKSDYIAALDKLIETRGMDCPLPLSGSAVKQYFPDEHYRLSERKIDNGNCGLPVSIKLKLNSASKSAAAIKHRWRRHRLNWRLLRRVS